jgi:hypothetical protein
MESVLLYPMVMGMVFPAHTVVGNVNELTGGLSVQGIGCALEIVGERASNNIVTANVNAYSLFLLLQLIDK